MRNSRRGSYIMEAAIVLPVIIMSVITVVLIIMFFYSQMTERSRMHIEMRKEAGKITGMTEYLHETGYEASSESDLYIERSESGGNVYGKKYIIMSHGGILGRKGVFAVEGTTHAVDAVQYVRFYNLVKELGNE